MAVLMREQSPDDTDADFQMGYLLHFHQRLGHLAYDSIERMAKDPESVIKPTDTKCPLVSRALRESRRRTPSRGETMEQIRPSIESVGDLLGFEGPDDAEGQARKPLSCELHRSQVQLLSRLSGSYEGQGREEV